MYSTILALHSLVRWFVLAGLLFAIVKAYKGWISKTTFTSFDNAVRHWAATIAHIQLMLGLCLYFTSPLVNYFLHHYKTAVHEREIRFFGMEHSIMMFIGIAVITVGSAKAKRKAADKDKFKTMAVWYTIALLIILTSIPWGFSPLVSRPYFRPFY
ncbi:MAG TPA: hypothetical protein VG738_19015 [Chitinophagaceae bacterium]|nr:hypothetical protein [Chitinophagaceae bacterium]